MTVTLALMAWLRRHLQGFSCVIKSGLEETLRLHFSRLKICLLTTAFNTDFAGGSDYCGIPMVMVLFPYFFYVYY